MMIVSAATEPPDGVVDQPVLRSGAFSRLDELFTTNYAPMVRLAHLMVGSAAVAEEIVQDALVRVSRKLDRVDNPGAYLRVAVMNGCRNERRRKAIERRYRDAGAGATREAALDSYQELADALAALPAKRRAAVVLRYYADLPEAEIAAVLDCRPGTVKSLLHRGLAQLKEALSDGIR
jgi:RNA polymerase sigma factor (sigma-70 family)